MRLIRSLVLVVIAIVLIVVALANRQAVTVRLVPDGLDGYIPFLSSVTVPLYGVMFGGIGVGLLIGFVWEWVRERKHRTAVRREHKEVVRLEREVSRLKADKNEGKDNVLALLDDAS